MDLLEKIRKIEALMAGAKSEGERQAAQFAKQRIEQKIAAKPIEFNVGVNSLWKKKLLVAICTKYGLKTYRYRRQKHTTTMIQVSQPFMNEVLWPEFKKYAKMFDELAEEILHGLISKIHDVHDEDEIVITGEISSSSPIECL